MQAGNLWVWPNTALLSAKFDPAHGQGKAGGVKRMNQSQLTPITPITQTTMTETLRTVDLHHTVSIHESLKQVVEVSRQINVVALNALLVSKRAGSSSAGFRVVAIELRTFSDKVQTMMEGLARLIADLVRRAAQLSKLKRRLGLFERILSRSAGNVPTMQARWHQMQNDYGSLRASEQDDWRQMEQQILRSLSLCKSGAMLSHNSRIEAAYGRTLLGEMQQISSLIGEVMERAICQLQGLQQLTTRLDGQS
jgi:hypothetical protein